MEKKTDSVEKMEDFISPPNHSSISLVAMSAHCHPLEMRICRRSMRQYRTPPFLVMFGTGRQLVVYVMLIMSTIIKIRAPCRISSFSSDTLAHTQSHDEIVNGHCRCVLCAI